MQKISKDKVELDALALEYQGDYGTACRNVDVLDTVNNPSIECKVCVFGLGLPKQTGDLPIGQLGMLGDDGTYPLLVTKKST